MTTDEFRRAGHDAIDWIADYLDNIEHFPVQSKVEPGAIRGALPAHPPLDGESFDTILRDVNDIVMPGITHWQSPSFFAYFPSNTSPPAILGELISAGIGVQGMLWSTSPACTELETHMMDWLVEMLDLPAAFKSDAGGGGVIQDTASNATLAALLAARERATDFRSNERGLTQTDQRRLVAYASTQTHSSLEKAMRIAGLGSENLRLIDVDEEFAMRPDVLDGAIRSDHAAGRVPFFVCATIGTTSTGAVDPLTAIADIAKQHDMWLHVDAAYAGTASICPEFRHFQNGVQHADSYTFNPHKWMLTNFDCNVFFVADRATLTRTFSILPEYLRNKPTEAGSVIDYRDWHVQLGRRFRALKLWFVIRSYGVEGIRAYVRRHVELARDFADWVRTDAGWDVVAPVHHSLVCFRHSGGDSVNQQILDTANASGRLFLTHTRLDGKLTLRMAIGGRLTERRHVEQAWQQLKASVPESA